MGVFEGEELLSYSFPPPHPFNSSRVSAFWEALHNSGAPYRRLKPQLADLDLVRLFHTSEHVRFVEMASAFGYGNLDRGDTPAFPGLLKAAQYCVGSTVAGV